MILKQVIRYDNAPALEATWVDENDIVIKCQAYSNEQMDLLANDLGDDAPTHQELMDEIAATYVPDPPAAPTPPSSVSMRQGRLALLQSNMLHLVDAAIAGIDDPVQKAAAEIEWEYATSIDRNSQFVQSLAAELNLTEQQLDDLFLLAATF